MMLIKQPSLQGWWEGTEWALQACRLESLWFSEIFFNSDKHLAKAFLKVILLMRIGCLNEETKNRRPKKNHTQIFEQINKQMKTNTHIYIYIHFCLHINK